MNNLVKITPSEFEVEIDLRYATNNNICKFKLYSEPSCYLHIDAAKKLSLAIKIASLNNVKLKIFDCFRPIKIQQLMFDKFPGDFVSNPKTGSIPHCRGVAIDLTLIDKNGNNIEMGSDFDEFSDLAFHDCNRISEKAKENRKLLLKIMTEAGFDNYSKEWWHYQLFNARSYPIIDLDL